MRMHHIVICGLTCSKICFHTIPNLARYLKKEKLLNTCFLFPLQLLSETFLILKRTERDMIKMCNGLHVKCQLFMSDFNET